MEKLVLMPEKNDFNQRTACGAPIRLSKYTTNRDGRIFQASKINYQFNMGFPEQNFSEQINSSFSNLFSRLACISPQLLLSQLAKFVLPVIWLYFYVSKG